jgi:hypothetical protein
MKFAPCRSALARDLRTFGLQSVSNFPVYFKSVRGQARSYKFYAPFRTISANLPLPAAPDKKTIDGSKSSLRQLRTFKTHVRLFGSEIAVFFQSGTRR